MNKKEFLRYAYRHGMVLVPREPTDAMLHCGEGITDLILPEEAFENSKEARMKEISSAWSAMIDQWEFEIAQASLYQNE